MSTVAWLLPFPIKGSGGHRTIFENARAMSRVGHDVTLWVQDACGAQVLKNDAHARTMLEQYYGPAEDMQIRVGWGNMEGKYDLLVATWWETARCVRDYPHAKRKAYFVQDFEAGFHSMGDGYLLAENTYRYGLSPISIGRWLAHTMQHHYDAPGSGCFEFCADPALYHPPETQNRSLTVCCIYQPEKPRRCPVLAIEALGIVKHLMPEVNIVLYGSEKNGHVWFEHENRKLVTPHDCAQIYQTSSVGLCISSSNPSRIPFEMMACGLPVVDIHRENNIYDMPDEAVLLAHQTPEAIAAAVIHLLKNEADRARRSAAGIEYMRTRTIESGFATMLESMETLLAGHDLPWQDIAPRYRAPAFRESTTTVDVSHNLKRQHRGGIKKQLAKVIQTMRRYV